MKGQDVVVLLALVAHPERRWTYSDLSRALKISASEAHAAIGRLAEARLVDPGERTPILWAVEEFLLHGLKYVFPGRLGPTTPGVPTAHSAEPLSKVIVASGGDAYVWPHADGTARGQSLEPLYPTAADAALADPKLHELLALIDALRIGRARERSLAAAEIAKRLEQARTKS